MTAPREIDEEQINALPMPESVDVAMFINIDGRVSVWMRNEIKEFDRVLKLKDLHALRGALSYTNRYVERWCDNYIRRDQLNKAIQEQILLMTPDAETKH